VLWAGPWKAKSHDFYVTHYGNMRLAVERAGATFRIQITRIKDKTQPAEVFYAGNAANAYVAMTIAEHKVKQVFARLYADPMPL
jgi:hypothetical protein